jgi:hypothetical protein
MTATRAGHASLAAAGSQAGRRSAHSPTGIRTHTER